MPQTPDEARNQAAIALLKSDFTHLLMLDIDHVHPYNIVQRLARWVIMDNGIQVVGGLNYRRSEPHDPCAYRMDENGAMYAIEFDKDNSQLVEVDRLGTGSILIAREVFEKQSPGSIASMTMYGVMYGGKMSDSAVNVKMASECGVIHRTSHITTGGRRQSWRDWLGALEKGNDRAKRSEGKWPSQP